MINKILILIHSLFQSLGIMFAFFMIMLINVVARNPVVLTTWMKDYNHRTPKNKEHDEKQQVSSCHIGRKLV